METEKNINRKLKRKIKSIPIIGKIASKAYNTYHFIKPSGKYWSLDNKAHQIDKNIKKLAELISGKEYDLTLHEDGRVHISLKNGVQFWWDTHDKYSLLCLPLYGFYEPESTGIALKLIKKGNTVFDIGANFGWYSCHFAKEVGETGRVHLFEPTDTINELNNNVSLNAFLDRCILNKVALSDKTGTSAFFIPDKMGTGAASLEPTGLDSVHSTAVSVITLDDYAETKNIKKIDFIKMDVEGAELLVLKGAKKVLKNFAPPIMLEIVREGVKRFNHTPEDIIEYLGGFGYTLYEIDADNPNTLKKVHTIEDAKICNYLAVKNAETLRKQNICVLNE